MRPDVVGIADLVLSRPALLGRTRLVGVEGPAGSGKTTLAGALAAHLQTTGHEAVVVHLDDVLEGWDGLGSLGARVSDQIVEPLAQGQPGRYRRYDWHAAALAEEVAVPASEVVVLEGVGAGHVGYADRVSVLVWVEAPQDVRLRRGIERDGPALEPQWHRWLVAEQDLHRAERTRERADVLVDGVTGAVVVTGRG